MQDEDRQVEVAKLEAHLFSRLSEANESFDWPEAGKLVVHTSRSPAKSTDNEDSALLFRVGDGRAIVAVADGVGGQPAGEQASMRALEVLRAALEERLADGTPLRECVLSGIDGANQAVQELGSGGATTLAAIEIDGSRIRAYHVGDAGVLAFGGRGKIKLETIPHSPVGYGVEAGLISEDVARTHEDRHVVFNVVGDPEMHVGISPQVELRPRDTVLLASDGLFDNLAVATVVETLRKGPLVPAVQTLVASCHRQMSSGGHADDLTLVAYRPAQPGRVPPAASRRNGSAS